MSPITIDNETKTEFEEMRALILIKDVDVPCCRDIDCN